MSCASSERPWRLPSDAALQAASREPVTRGHAVARRVLGESAAATDAAAPASAGSEAAPGEPFEHTYYDFPAERDFPREDLVPLHDRACRRIDDVPRTFFGELCMQGSGQLADERTVSFARRACACATACPRTGELICFDALDPARFPWGRGARGTAIRPLRTVAVDTAVIPLGTVLFMPDFVGMPLREDGSGGTHDGCFIAEDQGSAIRGKHLDVFAGSPRMTRLWNALVPTRRGVSVVVGSPHCDYLARR